MEKVMKKDTTKDMTQGSPMKLILGFSVPLLFGFLFQQLYSMVDTIIVGRFLGVNALAGVGSTGSLNFIRDDYWILYGRMQRVCDSLSAYVRREGLFGLTAFYGKWRVAVHPVFSGDDSAHNGFLPSDADGNEDSGGYLCPCLWLYFYYIFGDSGYVFV